MPTLTEQAIQEQIRQNQAAIDAPPVINQSESGLGDLYNAFARGSDRFLTKTMPNAIRGGVDLVNGENSPIGATLGGVADWMSSQSNGAYPMSEGYQDAPWYTPQKFGPATAEALPAFAGQLASGGPARAALMGVGQMFGDKYGETGDAERSALTSAAMYAPERIGMGKVLGKGNILAKGGTEALTESAQVPIEAGVDYGYGEETTMADMGEQIRDGLIPSALLGATGGAADPGGAFNVEPITKTVGWAGDKILPPSAITPDGQRMPIPQDDGVGDQTTSQMLIGEKGATKSGGEDATYAKQLERGGRSATEIQNTTGWFRNVDNNWVKEIDDSGMGFQSWPSEELADSGRTSGMLTKVIDHPKLFEAYPSLSWTLADIVIAPEYAGDKVQGAYYPGTRGASPKITVRAGTMEDALDTISHEIQHNVQAEEKHAGGTYVDSDAGYKKSAHSAKQQAAKQKIIDNQFPLREGERERLEAERQGHVGEIQQGIADFKSGASEETAKQAIDRVRARNQEIGYILGDSEFEVDELNPFEQYQADAGEISARQTEDRRKLTQAERDANVPYDGVENIAHDDLLSESKMTDEQKVAFKKSTGVQHDDVEGKMKVNRERSWNAKKGPTDPWIGPRPESKPADPENQQGPARPSKFDKPMAPDQMGPRTATQSEGGKQINVPSGQTLMSPNIKEDMTFEEAQTQEAKPRHKKLFAVAERLGDMFGGTKKLDSGIGDWADGAENTISMEFKNAKNLPYHQVKAIAAVQGLMGNQKSVIPFKTDEAGPDRMYTMDSKLPIAEARQALIDAGVENRTLIPFKGGTRIKVFTEGGKLGETEAMERFYEANPKTTKNAKYYQGHGEFLGSWTSRKEGYAAYKKALEEYIALPKGQRGGNDSPNNLDALITEALDNANQAGLFSDLGGSRAMDKVRNEGKKLLGKRDNPINRVLAEKLDQAKRFIHRSDRTQKTVETLANDMTKEMAYELSPKNRKNSGMGWYGPRVDTMRKTLSGIMSGRGHDVDLNAPEHKGLFTAILAITSDGTKLQDNLKSTLRTYENYLKTGEIKLMQKHKDATAGMESSFKALESALAEAGGDVQKMTDLLLENKTMKDWKDAGIIDKSDYPMDTNFPRSIILGPKIGAFYANMMGQEDHLTMDRWWNRTVNRMRGKLADEYTPAHLNRFEKALKASGVDTEGMAEQDIVDRAIEAQKGFVDKENRVGLSPKQEELRKSSNLLGKAATGTLDAPFNASDRIFQRRIAQQVQKNLKKTHGEDVTIADIQAVMWYFEKRLYAEQGLADSKSTSFEEELEIIQGQMGSGDWTFEKGNKKEPKK